ncbi:serine hydrolase [Nonomuraea candida]|uniref:serine hydrolase n=1 Tax=Nonomuraea candida TaxID=359159 RepID=UPI000A012C23|nr:serine hydrolase [Nonomuraea candida]
MRVREFPLFAALLLVLPSCTARPPDVAPRPVPVARPMPAPGSALPDDERRALDRTLARYLRHRPGRAALAVHDRTTGTRYAFGGGGPFLLASVAKVDILLALLHGRRGGRLTGHERELAERMIRHSDNDCAHELYLAIGGPDGLDRTLRRLGVRHTRPGSGLSWGYTRSGPSDQVRVLELLTDPAGPLPARDRRYALDLMSSVEPAQAWGVSAAAGPRGRVALKNGWLPAEAHDGLWTVNSVGRLLVNGHELLIAVLSERSPEMATGIDTVERLARLAVTALTRSPSTAKV